MHDRSKDGVNNPPENIRPEEEPPKVSGTASLDEKGFIFLDDDNRGFKCRLWEGEPWLFRWNKNDKCWTSVRKINQEEINHYYKAFNAGALQALKEILEQKHKKRIKDLEDVLRVYGNSKNYRNDKTKDFISWADMDCGVCAREILEEKK